MVRVLDLGQSVYALCTANPELVEILQQIGFVDIVKAGMLQTAGRLMTIPKGAAIKHIAMEDIRRVLEANGYQLSGGETK